MIDKVPHIFSPKRFQPCHRSSLGELFVVVIVCLVLVLFIWKVVFSFIVGPFN